MLQYHHKIQYVDLEGYAYDAKCSQFDEMGLLTDYTMKTPKPIVYTCSLIKWGKHSNTDYMMKTPSLLCMNAV